jgi:hypothetical protein
MLDTWTGESVNTLGFALGVILGLTILSALWDLRHPIPDTDTEPLELPAAHGWRPDRAWWTTASGNLVNVARGREWNGQAYAVGADQEWWEPLPEWLHPFHGLATL